MASPDPISFNYSDSTNYTTTSISLSLPLGSTPTELFYKIGFLTSLSQFTGATRIADFTDPIVITGLTPNTFYSFYYNDNILGQSAIQQAATNIAGNSTYSITSNTSSSVVLDISCHDISARMFIVEGDYSADPVGGISAYLTDGSGVAFDLSNNHNYTRTATGLKPDLTYTAIIGVKATNTQQNGIGYDYYLNLTTSTFFTDRVQVNLNFFTNTTISPYLTTFSDRTVSGTLYYKLGNWTSYNPSSITDASTVVITNYNTFSENSATTISGLSSKTLYSVWFYDGVNYSDVQNIGTAGVPNDPTDLSGTPSSTQIGLAWTAPGDNGGSELLYYTISKSGSLDVSLNATNTTYNYTGLSSSTSYTFTIKAANVYGASTGASITKSTTAGGATAPSAPTLTATKGNGQVDLSWNTPSDGGSAILYYDIFIGGVFDISRNVSLGTHYTKTGLTNGTTYNFTVRAVNAIDAGPFSSSEPATPSTTPGTPISLQANASNGSVLLSWTAPSTGGSAILYYQTSKDGGSTYDHSGTSLNYTYTGLTNNTPYTFAVRAVNAVGPSDPATKSATPNVGGGGGIGDPHIVTVSGKKYELPHDEGCYLLYDNQNESDRVIITCKNWKLPKDMLSKNVYLKKIVPNATYFRYLNVNHNGENLTIDMETLEPVRYTNKADMKNHNLLPTQFKNGNIKLLDVYDDVNALRYSYKFPRLIKFKKFNLDINFDGKSRDIIINSSNPFIIRISYDLNCFDTRNKIKIVGGTHFNCIGAFIDESETNQIEYLVPSLH